MRSFYEAVSRCNPEKQNLAVTVLDGLHFGEKALFSEGQLIFDTEKNGYLEEHAEEIWMAARNRCRDGTGFLRLAGAGKSSGYLRRGSCFYSGD